MGTLLDKPRTEKYNESNQADDISYGLSTMQGWRVDMEDAHTAKIGLTDRGPLKNWSFFAVFDGHAGCKVAHYGAEHLLDTILATKEISRVVTLLSNDATAAPSTDTSSNSGTPAPPESSGNPLSDEVRGLIRDGLRSGFLTMDLDMRQLPDLCSDSERSGSTAVAVLITPNTLFFANLGDSRAILSRSGTVHFGTVDHKPYLAKERARILNAGGSVMIQRVNGSLAVSRALGDYEYKNTPDLGPCEQLVSPEPDVYEIPREDGDEFVLLACDGVFDVMSNEEVSDLIRSRLRVTHDLPSICNQVTDACLSRGSSDNMSLIIVTLPGAPPIDPARVQEEEALKSDLEDRVRSIAAICGSSNDLDGEYVLRVLQGQEINNVPPGAGLHALRSYIDDVVKKVKAESEPADNSVD